MGRLIRLDWAIKNILRDKANFDILEGFLSELLRFDVTIQEILESESNKPTQETKFNRVDLLVKNEEGQLLIIEVQNDTEADYLQRLMFGTSKAKTEHIIKGSPYSTIKKIYSISIVYFDLGVGDDYLYHGETTFTGLRKSTELGLTESQKELYKAQRVADLFPEYYLIKVPKFDDTIRDTLDEWIYFLKNESVKESFKAKGLDAAKSKLDVLNMSEEDRRSYESYLQDLHYQASMWVENQRMAFIEGKIAVVKNMLAADMDHQTIANLSDLTLGEVKRIADS